MKNLNRISVVSTAEGALKKLKKQEIAVYDCKKKGADFIFCVKDKDVKKVFAIFAKPCYNIRIVEYSARRRVFSGALLRIGLIAGALVFTAMAALSDFFILKIEVYGSGSYLQSVVREIIASEGAGEGKPFSALDMPVAAGRILSLPSVTFCNIEKRGSVLLIDVEVDAPQTPQSVRQPLISDADGTLVKVVAICGTAAVRVGDRVSRGDVLIHASMLVGEQTVDCLAVGYAEIECSRTAEYLAPDDSEASIKKAYASLLIDGDDVISRSHRTEPAESGVKIIMDVTYLHKISINLS